MKIYYLIVGLAIGISSLLFQNCEARLSTYEKATSFQSASNSESMNPQDEHTTNFSASPNNATEDLKAIHQTSYAAQIDCSRIDATLKSEVNNAGSDILVCSEYTLAMPNQSQRFGEFYKCDSPNKFVRPPIGWRYNLTEKKWTADLIYLQNHAFLVPGDYTLAVMDNQGKIYRSSPAVIRKSGSENCLVNSTSNNASSVCKIQTATGELDFSPSLVGKACTSNSDKAIVDSKGWYVCKCN